MSHFSLVALGRGGCLGHSFQRQTSLVFRMKTDAGKITLTMLILSTGPWTSEGCCQTGGIVVERRIP